MATKMKSRKKKSVNNAFYVNVRVCCASCQHLNYINGDCRVCELTGKVRKPRAECGQWKMRGSLLKAGMDRGQVKSKRYLKFALNMVLKEDEAIKNGILTEEGRTSVQQLRLAYEVKYGQSIYEMI